MSSMTAHPAAALGLLCMLQLLLQWTVMQIVESALPQIESFDCWHVSQFTRHGQEGRKVTEDFG